MKVGEWLQRRAGAAGGHAPGTVPAGVATVTAETTLEEAVDRLLRDEGTREVFVIDDDGRLIGHLPHRRLASLLLAELRPRHSRRHLAERALRGTVRELMHRPHLVRMDDGFEHAVHCLLERGDESLPVVDESQRLVGIISLTDVLRAFRAGAL